MEQPTRVCHVVAIPFPGRGHIDPMMSLCRKLAAQKPNMIITVVVTEEWAGLIGPDPRPESIRLATVPNVVPSERDRARDKAGFIRAVMTNLGGAVEVVLDGLETPVRCVVADCALTWAVAAAKKRNTPVALLWTMSASMFSLYCHFRLLRQNGHFPLDLSERGHEVVDYIPGISPTRSKDLPLELFERDNQNMLEALITHMASEASKAQYLLLNSVYELELDAFNVLRALFPFPVYSIGLHYNSEDSIPGYLQWLDSQPESSVLYISFGSFLSVSAEEMEEIVAGVYCSGVRYFWVTRDCDVIFNASESDDKKLGYVVPWCDQQRVLCHPSIVGFLTHCGWNSILEGVFAGLPMLTLPLYWDQNPNSKKVVEDWKIGYRVTRKAGSTMMKDEISRLARGLMDLDANENILMRKRVQDLREVCRRAVVGGGSSDADFEAFVKGIS